MSLRRTMSSLVALSVVVGLLPAYSATAAVNRPPKIKKAVMKDKDGDGLADKVVLTYSERIKHKVDRRRFPFKVAGYRIKKINGARGTRRLVILLRENADAPLKPASISYKRTRQQPVTDMKNKQARKQFLSRNIVGLAAAPPPAGKRHTLTVVGDGDGEGVVTSQPAGIDCGSTCTADFDDGTAVTLTATPDEASDANFGGWQGCASTTQTCTVTMDSDKTVTATFTQAGQFALQVLKNGTGTGTVTSTSTPTQANQIDCGATCTVTFPENSVVALKAVPDAASKATIAGWSGGGCSGTGDTCNVLMNQAHQVTVTFNLPVQHRMTVTKNGTGDGSVTSTSNPSQTSQVDCGSLCQVDYPEGTSVTVTATPAAGSKFAGWGGAATCGTNPSCTIPMDGPKNVTATFHLESTGSVMHTLTVTKTGTGTGGLTCSADGGTPAACDASYPAGTVLVLTATPDLGSVFTGWGGDCADFALLPCTVNMTQDRVVTANFDLVGAPPLFGQQR